jgi:hypothetical protein
MSTPISAISSATATLSTPGDVSEPGRLPAERRDRLLDARVERADLSADAVTVV